MIYSKRSTVRQLLFKHQYRENRNSYDRRRMWLHPHTNCKPNVSKMQGHIQFETSTWVGLHPHMIIAISVLPVLVTSIVGRFEFICPTIIDRLGRTK